MYQITPNIFDREIIISVPSDFEFLTFYHSLEIFLKRCTETRKKIALGTWNCSDCPFDLTCENDNTAEPHYKNYHKKNLP